MDPLAIAKKTMMLLTKDIDTPWFFDEEEWTGGSVPEFVEACPFPITTLQMRIDDYRLWIMNLLKRSWAVGETKDECERSTVQLITAHRTALMLNKKDA